ncbi:putative porin [Alteromonas gilva]|uniref:Porin n=1 Tax=Alteromonas gilva TaxID=2987522 RepID=A0ABT5KYF3_9ALTE|nr:putative porin [Alteromonas gilva]MDC8829663.1 putative porin [Alteromonas gilva]
MQLFRLSPLLAFFSVPVFSAQNEISVGISDLDDYGNQFVGVEYRRYLSDIQPGAAPYSLSPYLNKLSSVYGRYFSVDNFDLYELGSEWFVDDKWVVRGNIRYADYPQRDYLYTARNNYLSARVDSGYFITPNWQVGAGLTYETLDISYREQSRTLNESIVSLFGRYTNINDGTGWDVLMTAYYNDSARVEVDADYYFSPRFSLGLAYNTEVFVDDAPYSEGDMVEVKMDYWLTKGWSLEAGIGVHPGASEFGLATVTLATRLRF